MSRPTALESHPGVVVKRRTDRANRSGPTWTRSTVPPPGRMLQAPALDLDEMLLAGFFTAQMHVAPPARDEP